MKSTSKGEPSQAVDPEAVRWIANSSIPDARPYIARANEETLKAAVRELRKRPFVKTYLKLINARLRKLWRQGRSKISSHGEVKAESEVAA